MQIGLFFIILFQNILINTFLINTYYIHLLDTFRERERERERETDRQTERQREGGYTILSLLITVHIFNNQFCLGYLFGLV